WRESSSRTLLVNLRPVFSGFRSVNKGTCRWAYSPPEETVATARITAGRIALLFILAGVPDRALGPSVFGNDQFVCVNESTDFFEITPECSTLKFHYSRVLCNTSSRVFFLPAYLAKFRKINKKIIHMIATMRRLIALWVVLTCVPLYAQDTVRFTTGLAVGGVHRYGREAIVQDQLAWQLFTGKLQHPATGQALYTDDENRAHRWEQVEVDSTGRFRGEALSSGYLYLEYESPKEQTALLNVMGNSMSFVNGEPRGGDIYRDGWMHVPVLLKKGSNQILIRCSRGVRWQGIEARLILLQQPVTLLVGDPTLPHIVAGKTSGLQWGAVVVSNATNRALRNLTLTSTLEGKSTVTNLPDIPPMTTRKVGFQFDPSNAGATGKRDCHLQLKQGQKILDEQKVTIETMDPSSQHSYTFTSEIDGSVQYFAVTPQTGGPKEGSALFLSVHGAGVEAIGQARAYDSKEWGTLVAPTNRRPRGFNWEDWG